MFSFAITDARGTLKLGVGGDTFVVLTPDEARGLANLLYEFADRGATVGGARVA